MCPACLLMPAPQRKIDIISHAERDPVDRSSLRERTFVPPRCRLLIGRRSQCRTTSCGRSCVSLALLRAVRMGSREPTPTGDREGLRGLAFLCQRGHHTSDHHHHSRDAVRTRVRSNHHHHLLHHSHHCRRRRRRRHHLQHDDLITLSPYIQCIHSHITALLQRLI